MSPFLSLLALAPMLVAAADEASPRAVPVEAVADLGVVPRAETVLHSFEIRNDGGGDLELTEVRPACGCISVDFDRSIAPGEVGVINVRLNTSRFRGPIEESITVYTNDTASPKLQLVTKARVEAVLVAEPGYARFLYVQQEPTRPITQLIWAQDGTDFDILDVRSPYPYVLVEVRMADAGERAADHPGKQWAVLVRLDPNAPVGSLAGNLEVLTNNPAQQRILIPVSGFVRPRLSITPNEADFGSIARADRPITRALPLKSFTSEGIRVTRIESDVPGVSVEVKEGRDANEFELLLTVGPEVPTGPFHGVVDIHTTDRVTPILRLPIRGEIR